MISAPHEALILRSEKVQQHDDVNSRFELTRKTVDVASDRKQFGGPVVRWGKTVEGQYTQFVLQ